MDKKDIFKNSSIDKVLNLINQMKESTLEDAISIIEEDASHFINDESLEHYVERNYNIRDSDDLIVELFQDGVFDEMYQAFFEGQENEEHIVLKDKINEVVAYFISKPTVLDNINNYFTSPKIDMEERLNLDFLNMSLIPKVEGNSIILGDVAKISGNQIIIFENIQLEITENGVNPEELSKAIYDSLVNKKMSMEFQINDETKVILSPEDIDNFEEIGKIVANDINKKLASIREDNKFNLESLNKPTSKKPSI